MADDVTLPGTGEVVAAKEISAKKYQRFLLVSPAGTDLAYVTGNNGTGPGVVVLNDVPVVGLNADDAVMITDNYPVYIGGRVRLGTAIVPLAADGDAGGLTVTGDRRVVTAPIGCPEDQGVTTPVVAPNSTASTFQLIAAQAAPVKIALWGLECVNLNTTTDTSLILYDGSAEIGRIGIPRFPGIGKSWPAPFKTTPGVALTGQLTTAVGANALYLTPLWFKTRA